MSETIKPMSLNTTAIRQKIDSSVPGQKEKGATDKKIAEQEKAATDFEALLLHQMLNSMWATVEQSSAVEKSHEEKLYRDMLNEALAQSLAKERSIGIKDAILQDMQKLENGEEDVSS
jgi:Rod binding domain-containing protein